MTFEFAKTTKEQYHFCALCNSLIGKDKKHNLIQKVQNRAKSATPQITKCADVIQEKHQVLQICITENGGNMPRIFATISEKPEDELRNISELISKTFSKTVYEIIQLGMQSYKDSQSIKPLEPKNNLSESELKNMGIFTKDT